MGLKIKVDGVEQPSGVSGESQNKTSPENIIWDLSSQLGEANHKIKMLEWKIAEMNKILNG